MRINRTLGCTECGHQWKHLFMNEREPIPRCPRCAGKPERQLSAPALGLNAPDVLHVPQSQSAREKMAADIALSGTGMGDINSHMKPGDIAAKPLPVEVPREMPQEVKEQARTRFAPITGTAAERGAMIRSLGAATPSADKQRNMNLLGKMNR